MTETIYSPWPAVLIVLPLASAVVALLAPFRYRSLIGIAVALGVFAVAITMGIALAREGAVSHSVGGWGAPLGIDIRVDGLSFFMLAATAVVGLGVSVYAAVYISASGQGEKMAGPVYFWPLWLLLLGTLNALFVSRDIFNVYVTLELLGVSAVALAALNRQGPALAAALRYLLVGLLASLFYLLGTAFLYAEYGVLDMQRLGILVSPSVSTYAAVSLITVALLVKSALFPAHFWLPPAHANAPAPISAALSALVVKAAFYLVLRLWFDVFPGALSYAAGNVLGTLGAVAILWGSVQAIRQERLKMIVAYSTVAQIGYLFIGIPLVLAGAGAVAWAGVAYFAISHACAKAAMFLSVGNIMHVAGHDRLSELEGIGSSVPVTVFALGLAGVTLMGLPPSGGFIAKWTLLHAAVVGGQWWWAVVVLFGSLLAAVYVFRIVSRALCTPLGRERPIGSVPLGMIWPALALSVAALLLGLCSAYAFGLLRVGASVGRWEALL